MSMAHNLVFPWKVPANLNEQFPSCVRWDLDRALGIVVTTKSSCIHHVAGSYRAICSSQICQEVVNIIVGGFFSPLFK